MKTSSEVEHFPKDQGAADAPQKAFWILDDFRSRAAPGSAKLKAQAGSRMLLSLLAARAKPTVAKKAKAKAPAKVQPGLSLRPSDSA